MDTMSLQYAYISSLCLMPTREFILFFVLFSFVNNATHVKRNIEKQEFESKVLNSEASKIWRKDFICKLFLLMFQMTEKEKTMKGFQYQLKMPLIITKLILSFLKSHTSMLAMINLARKNIAIPSFRYQL